MSALIIDTPATCKHCIQEGTAPSTLQQHIRLQVGSDPTSIMEIFLQKVLCDRLQSGKTYRVLIEEITD